MDEDEITTLKGYMEVKDFAASSTIFNQGDVGNGLFFLTQGRVEVYAQFDIEESKIELPRFAQDEY